MPDYTREQFWKLYEKLPQELKDALSSDETGDNIYDICKRNEILEKLDQIVKYVGQVLVGILPPEDFQKILEKEVKLKKSEAKTIAHEINRFVFFPVKDFLAELYKMEVASPAKEKAEVSEGPATKVDVPETGPSFERMPSPPQKDTYRELVE